jgi:tetratricopeptide (TPR) repeat protein
MEWRTLSIFVSSTFQDMYEERDILREYVFPALEERLHERRHYLEVTDLRWGIFTEDAANEAERETHILSVCLTELERSRPFFLALLGDRYGWVPPEGLIERTMSEKGLKAQGTGKSITELEIEIGAIDPPFPTRPLIYIRHGLPTEDLTPEDAARYSDAAAGKASHAAKLGDLKRRLRDALPERVRSYQVGWDAESHRVVSLEEFGRTVLEDLWREIADETDAYRAVAPVTPEEEDRAHLASFVEHYTRNFVGRTELIERLAGGAAGGESGAVAIVGPPGSGKSALFARLHRIFEVWGDAILLAHSAGVGPRGASIDGMVLRFIKELTAKLGLPGELSADADGDKIDRTFAEYLGLACESAPVVLLIDAIEQFEESQRARYVLWLPRHLPPNFHLIVTGLPCDAIDILVDRPYTEGIELPGLDADEAGEVVQNICRQYRRELTPQILSALLSNRPTGGPPSYGNPLWLSLATEQLNLVRSDDYLRAARAKVADAEKRLTAMLSEMAASFPPEVTSLCQHMLAYLEDIYGTSRVSAFSSVLALRRHGWRDLDLRAILPAVNNFAWAELDIARMRRAFRGQLRYRFNEAYLAFIHREMGRAAYERYVTDYEYERSLNLSVANHLKSLPEGDELKSSDLVYHSIMAEKIGEAVHHLVSVRNPVERAGAIEGMAQMIVRLESKVKEPGNGALSLLANTFRDSADPIDAYAFALDLATYVDEAIEKRVPLEARRNILESSLNLLTSLIEEGYDDTYFRQQVASGQHRLGEVLRQLGRDEGARENYERVLAEAERLVEQNPREPGALRRLALCHFNIGQAQLPLGNLEAACNAFGEALRLAEIAASLAPEEPMHQSGVAAVRSEIGNMFLQIGMLEDARAHFDIALSASRRALELEPDSQDWQSDLSTTMTHIGEVLEREGNSAEALQWHRRALDIREALFHRDPDYPYRAEVFAISLVKVGNLLHLQGDSDTALRAATEAIRLFTLLTGYDAHNRQWGKWLKTATELLSRIPRH